MATRGAEDTSTEAEDVLAEYSLAILETARHGAASEASHYRPLELFLERMAKVSGAGAMRALALPRLGGALCPDIQVVAGSGRVVGYVEAKPPGTSLRHLYESEQIRRYRRSFPNLLLTDFRAFDLFRDEELVASVGDRWTDSGAGSGLVPLLASFLGHEPAPVRSAGELARGLADRARHLKEMIEARLLRELEGDLSPGDLAGYYRAFSKHLIAGLKVPEFADLYAQTLAFGLFAARTRTRDPETFGLATAASAVPESVGVLRDAFRYISIADPPDEVRWILDDLVGLLRAADVDRIFRRWFHDGRGGDPIVHFYETFLERYDSQERDRRGVFYTPLPLVSYVVRSVHRLLIDALGFPHGLADRRVRLLDPAAGTLPFVTEAWKVAREAHAQAFGEGASSSLRHHLLDRFAAFELMMAPYAVGHLKIGYLLEEWGMPLGARESFPFFLTNTLEGTPLAQSDLPGMASLSRESVAAERLKKDPAEAEDAVNVIVGNPPYRGHSANREGWIDELIRDGYERPGGEPDDGYYRVEGEPLGEKNPKWLQDDYVKFLRFAQWKIDRAGEGVVALVLNHGYLDNPTFRGLRESLLGTFDRLYLLDLHGNPNKREEGPDENVFAIKQGVSVALLVKKPGISKAVFRADLRGSRREKLDWLAEHDVESTAWTEIEPRPPHFLFGALDRELAERYRRFVPLTEIFPVRSVGVVTGRDAFAIDRTRRRLEAEIDRFARWGAEQPVEELWPRLRRTRTWDPEAARRAVADDLDWRQRIVPILYRPFDSRWVFYSDAVIERPRRAVMEHMLRIDNLGLVVPRQGRDGTGALVTDRVVGHKAVSAYDINTLFPLWLAAPAADAAPTGRQPILFGEEESAGEEGGLVVRANIAPRIAKTLAAAYGAPAEPRRLLAYVYAVLHAPAYRRRYAELLELDFPRIPFPREAKTFQALAALGERLIGLHLLRDPSLDRPTVRLEGPPGPVALSPKPVDYRPDESRVVVSAAGHAFTGLVPEIWTTEIGGHQVLRRFLRDRARTELSREEIETFCRTATALAATQALHDELDDRYQVVEQETDRFGSG